jgi:hypothetical protein
MNRLAPSAILLLVTPLLLAYGSSGWSWVVGPLAAIAVRMLEAKPAEATRRPFDVMKTKRPTEGSQPQTPRRRFLNVATRLPRMKSRLQGTQGHY